MKEIADKFYMITLPMPFRLGHVHVFALVHANGVALIDTGMNSQESFLKLESSLKAIGKTIQDIDRIFITHYHMDHSGIAGRIKEISGAAILMSEVDGQWIHDFNKNKMDPDQIRKVYRQHGMAEAVVETFLSRVMELRKSTIPFQVDEFMKPFEHRTIGDFTFEVIPTPGHTRGQVCFFFREKGILLSADHVLPHITPNLTPDPYHPEFRPLCNFLKSLHQIKDLPVSRVYPAHGEPFTDLKKRITEMEEHHQERKGLIFEAVKKGEKTALQISRDIFGSNLPEFDQFLAVNESYSHLLELMEEGLIRQERKETHALYMAS
jgi:glyoxylase-like metal-dependent hydrolase (beta-lactamase superfamily II)